MFDTCFVLNLDSRPDRMKRFNAELPSDWPFPQPVRFAARTDLDERARRPNWWKQTPGSWGCLQSHVAIWRQCLDRCWQSVLVLEDDVVFCDRFAERTAEFLAEIPADWQMVYIGGEHYRQNIGLPVQISSHAMRAWNVNRTHAYAIRDELIERAIAWVTTPCLPDIRSDKQHIDHRLGYLHEALHGCGIYCPMRWLAGQAAGESDIARTGRTKITRGKPDFFNNFLYWAGNERQRVAA